MSQTKVSTDPTRADRQATNDDNRRHPRRSTRAAVGLQGQGDDGNREATAVIVNVSAQGFGVRTDKSFPLGESVTVKTPERSLECVIRHVEKQPYSFMAYNVGLEIVSASDGCPLEHSLQCLSASLDASLENDDESVS